MAEAEDVALQRARERAAQLTASIAQLAADMAAATARLQADKVELRKVERFIASWHEIAGTEHARGVRPRNPDRREVAALALAEIRKTGRPLPRRELFQRLVDGGLLLAGKDPEMVLGTMLYRDKRIVRLRGHGYWDAGAVHEPAFYWPEHEQVIGAVDKDPAPGVDGYND